MKLAEEIVKFLFSTEPFSFNLFPKRVYRALFRERDPELLLAVQEELEKLSQKEPLSEPLIGRIVALYPFLEPTGALDVPLLIDGEWKVITYSIEKIALTPTDSPLTAFGLTAPSHPSLLLFMGTALPSMTGHLFSIWTDFVPGFAVGELAFHLFAKQKIGAWLNKQQKPVIIYGQSLGAALALHTVCAFENQIQKVYAFCPPALYKRSYSSFKGNADVLLYWHKNDIVPLIGRGFHPLWKMFYIESRLPQSPFFAHVRVIPALSLFSIQQRMPSRRLWPLFTLLHTLLSIPIFCITSLLLIIRKLFKKHFRRR